MIEWIEEVYEENINPEVVKEYERYIKYGLIRVYNPIDEYKSEEVTAPMWTIIKLTEQELIRRINEAKKLQLAMRCEGNEIEF